MVKFAKHFESQLVPEWRGAYVTYKLLKKDLKLIKKNVQERRGSDVSSQPSGRTFTGNFDSNRPSQFSRMHGSFETFVALTGQALGGKTSRRSSRKEAIQVRKSDGNPWEVYETVLDDHIQSDKFFFSRLDAQFNKVNLFYRTQEKDFVDHAETLEKQMEALVEMQRTLAERQHHNHFPTSSTFEDHNGKENSESVAVDMRFLESSTGVDPERTPGSSSTTETHDGNMMMTDVKFPNGASNVVQEGQLGEIIGSPSREFDAKDRKPAPPLQHTMRMRIPRTTPSATISVLSQTLWDDVLNRHSHNTAGDKAATSDEFVVSKKNVLLAEKMLRAAFVEYYRGLAMLKSYSSLNMVAFGKILKKYDKVSGQMGSATYLAAVETSYFITSDRIMKLMDKVETLFTSHFANQNRRKAMLSLRPGEIRASHTVTFTLGLFSGGSVALLAVFCVLAHRLLPYYRPINPNGNGSLHREGRTAYAQTVFPVFSMVALISLHVYMYGINLYYWRRLRINYPFIFEFQPGSELRHREVLMIATILTTLLMGTMVVQLAFHSTSHSPYIDFLPFALVMILTITLFFPLNVCYSSSRKFFLNTMLHIVGSPLYKVLLADFFMADQLTSQVPMLRNLQYVMCYYLSGYFTTGSADKCYGNHSYKVLTYFISLMPYWWRLMQCVRRFIDEADKAHIANGGKYLSALIAVAIRIQYGRNSSNGWLAMYIISSFAATMYQLYWDIVVDWGLLRRDSTNPWLRDRLIMPKKKYVYFLSMVINVILRLAWVQSVTHFKIKGVEQQITDFGFASLEVIRRGHWNFYRLENEHLNNVGKYRATRTVPLPFQEPTEDDEYLAFPTNSKEA